MNAQQQLTIPFSEDRATQIYLARVENKNRAESNCHKLLAFWQKNNMQIDKYYAGTVMGIDCLSQRVANLNKAGVKVKAVIRYDLGEKQARYCLECTCGNAQFNGCYLHDADKRVV